jgi:aspartate aminotransferase
MVKLADADPVIVETTAESGFRMTAKQLEGAITERTRLVIFNSPCNPTGAVYSRDDWEALGMVLRHHPDITILTDDIYEHILWTGEPFSTIAAACPDLLERTVTVNGVSKSYAMTGWRVGYAAGPAALITAMTSLQGQSTTNPSSISQAAATAALNGDQSCVVQMCRAFKERYDYVLPRLNAIPGVRCAPAGGAFYAFPNVAAAIARKGLADDVELCLQLMERAGVALVPGSAFGAPGHLRMSFASSIETLGKALDRIERYVAS